MKTRYILSCLLLGGALSVSAQKTAVKSNLLSAANGALNAGVESAFGLKSTLDLSGSIRPWKRTEGITCSTNIGSYNRNTTTGLARILTAVFGGAYLNGSAVQRRREKDAFRDSSPGSKSTGYAGWLAGGGITAYGYHITSTATGI